MKTRTGIVVLALFAATRAFAGPEQEVAAVLADLRGQRNYSWTRELDDASLRISGPLGGPASVRSGSAKGPDTFGRTENDGLTIWNSKPDRRSDRTVTGVNQGDHCIVNDGDIWRTLAELDLERRAGARELRALKQGEERSVLAAEQSFKAHVLSVTRLGHLTPGVMLQAIEGEMQDFSQAGGVIWANLTGRGAQRVIELVKESRLVSSSGLRVHPTLGAVKLWVRAGHLEKMEVLIEGRITSNTMSPVVPQIDLSQTYTFTFDQFGTSDPRVPKESQEKLADAGKN